MVRCRIITCSSVGAREGRRSPASRRRSSSRTAAFRAARVRRSTCRRSGRPLAFRPIHTLASQYPLAFGLSGTHDSRLALRPITASL
jgi:hypothetical protein